MPRLIPRKRTILGTVLAAGIGLGLYLSGQLPHQQSAQYLKLETTARDAVIISTADFQFHRVIICSGCCKRLKKTSPTEIGASWMYSKFSASAMD